MPDSGVLLSYYVEEEDAREALGELRRDGYRRLALIRKRPDGGARIEDLFRLNQILGGVIGAVLLGIIAGLWKIGYDQILDTSISLEIVIPISAGVLIGASLGWLSVRLTQMGVDRGLLRKHAKWTLPEENLLILQTTPRRMGRASRTLRRVGDPPPTIFTIHPEREYIGDRAGPHRVPLSPDQLYTHGRALAREHGNPIPPEDRWTMLDRLEDAQRVLDQVSEDLSQADKLEQSISLSAEWILDNAYIIRSHIRDVKINLPPRFYRELPILPEGPLSGLPRVYALASDLVLHSDGRLDQQNIQDFIGAYQSVKSLSIAELWAFPMMLRIAIIERLQDLIQTVDARLREHELADFWSNRLLVTARNEPSRLFSILAELSEDQPTPSTFFASHIIAHLYDEEAALIPAQSWLERNTQLPLGDLHIQEQKRQAATQISIGNAITSLRELSLLDWREIFEQESVVERALRGDPAGIYAGMDFETRDRYRKAVEMLARRSGLDEAQVAETALLLASAPPPGHREAHVGYYLLDAGRKQMLRRLECSDPRRRRFIGWLHQHHTAAYISSITILTLLFEGGFLAGSSALGIGDWRLFALAAVAAIFPASQLATSTINYLITRLLPPVTLPKMSFEESGIPAEFRSLVIVPVILADTEMVREEIEKLEIRYLANPEANLLFGLFGDFSDSLREHAEGDSAVLETAVDGIRELNRRYNTERFFYFHREREWSQTERRYIGWERKRGKLEELNQLLSGEKPRSGEGILRVGTRELLDEVRFVITLDSDTQLPPNSARRMVETLAHPLNQPAFDEEGNLAEGTYSIIQPRVSTALPSATQTWFSQLFTDPVGTDPYTKAVSDVYMDLAKEGSYIGKGIYDVRAFHQLLSDRFPEGLLLSHDLIEGAHVRVGLATDIELFDDFPADYITYARRQHRWIRGDWQIADWVSPKVPRPDGSRGSNPLSILNRWKIFDNLRRSLVEPASILMLLAAWLHSPLLGAVSGVFIAAMLLFQPLTQPVTWATSRAGWRRISLGALGRDLLRSIVEAALLPYRAGMAVDAIVRVVYRRWVSGRHLLEWTTAQMTGWETSGRIRSFTLHMGLISLFSLLVLVAVWRLHPADLLVAIPFLALWLLSPVLGVLLNRPRVLIQAGPDLSARGRQRLRVIARRTWRYFDDFVGPDTHWLPPDNYQVSHRDQLTMRTSPTNIGLWLVSALAALDFGYLTVEQLLRRVGASADSVDALARYEGHLLNWYDLETRQPLEPRYVSMVDSGNLLTSLWTLGGGLRQLGTAPILDEKALGALGDTLSILGEEANAVQIAPELADDIEDLSHLIRRPVNGIGDLLERLRAIEAGGEAMERIISRQNGGGEEWKYWAARFLAGTQDWLRIADRYLGWHGPLLEFVQEAGGALEPELVSGLSSLSEVSPSLADLAGTRGEWLSSFRQGLKAARDQVPEAASAIKELEQELNCAQENASGRLQSRDRLLDWCQEISAGINMRFLYNQRRRLFAIGFNVSQGRMDDSYYDLLASEARLGSFAAIASGQVPYEHWLALNRPFGAVDGGSALLSWSGTMFEYLMPLLLQRSFDNSLLDQAAHQAVRVQRRYARRLRVPWGISESAYGDLDPNKTYQYKAFGVPALGLKRGLDEDLVVAPYATLLAILIKPSAAMRNLDALSDIGLESSYGYYEAIDFGRAGRRPGERGVIVRAYMAHHQAMGLLALDNVLNAGPMQSRFHSDPRVKANEALLYERIPVSPPIHHVSARDHPRSPAQVEDISPAVSKFETARTANPKTQLLSNGDYSLLITAAGGGWSRWKDFDVTRWRVDTTRDHWGTFCYLRDVESDALWSTSLHPTGIEGRDYHVSFAIDRAEISRIDNGIEAESEIIVSPEDDVEIRRITLRNRSLRNRTIEITSYVELAMATHAADRQHPAFSKLFVETERVPNLDALIAWRRARGPEDPSVYVGHMLSFEDEARGVMQFETDRREFIGRGRTLANPVALEGGMGNSQGFVLDPIFSLRKEVYLRPGGQVQFSLILAASDERAGLLALLEKYMDARAIERAFEFAWAQAQLELRQLRIQPDDARRFQKMASFMVYPDPQFRPPPDRLRANKKDQSGLWPYGISGDLPIALVSISEMRDLTLVRQMLQAHTYWHHHGLKADLVILNEESSAYEQPLHEQLHQMIQAHSTYTGIDVPGGVFLRVADQIPEADLNLLLAVARVSLVAARGSVAQQLGTPREDVEYPPLKEMKQISRDPSPRLSHIPLSHTNGLGGFTRDGREYVIYLGPERLTPAPWSNVISNENFGTLVTESGSGFSWYGNSQRNRLTPWSNDPVSDQASEAIYIRDEESGEFWTPTPSPIRERNPYRVRHAPGYSVCEHNSHAIEQELLTFVPIDADGGDPIRVQRLRLRNDSAEGRDLTITFYLDWVLGEERESTQMHVITSWDSESKALFARNRYNPDYGERLAFAALSPEATEYTGDRSAFLGRNGRPEAPEAMRREGLTGRVGAGLDPCAALQARLELDPGQEREVIILLGQAGGPEEARDLIRKYSERSAVQAYFKGTGEWWDRILGSLQVDVPDSAVRPMLNRWLLYQNLSCRLWGRSAFYQSGGAYGFRDQLQDVMALLYAAPELARVHILRAAKRQFPEGDVQHWWHPPSGAGVRTRISDDMLWLPFVVSRYVTVTGDSSILDQDLPFLLGPELGKDEQEVFGTPDESMESASLYEHCRRAIKQASTRGPHGLPLIGAGDWNDGLNRVGVEGQGESIWLAFFLIDVLKRFGDTAEQYGRHEDADGFRSQGERLAEAVERAGWDGDWYRRAYFDDGTPLGSTENKEAKIDLLPQSWSVLSGAGDPDRSRTALLAAYERLVRQDQGMILLFTPPFNETGLDPGYIKGYPPGVRENGGQYTHGAIWLAMAFARLGDGDRAAELLRMLNPLGHADDPEKAQRYRVEPFVLAGDVYDLPGRRGMGGWSWYTGSAGWYYRAWIEEILGFKLRGDRLRIDPVMPRSWDGFGLRYRHGQALYEIRVENPEAISRGVKWISLDGKRMKGEVIQLEKERTKHRVVVRMG